jgi:16S rRNA (uracil1498-N3)-methyltransferase
MPTFIVASNDAFDAPFELAPEDERHLLRVMRASIGDEFRVTNLRGKIARVQITATKPLNFKMLDVITAAKPAPITVCLALIDQKHLEWAIEKLTELNVERVKLIACARSQQRELSADKLRRLTMIASEALKQCGRGWPLIIQMPVSFAEALSSSSTTRLFGSLNTNAKTDFKTEAGLALELWIGPEGGFTIEEEEKLKASEAHSLTLGSTILRAETAAVALTALIISHKL